MVTSQYGRTVALGLAGRLVCLLFAASAAAGIYGVCLASFVSFGQVDPGHDTVTGTAVTGTAVMGIAFSVSLIAVMLIYPPTLRRGAGPHWHLFTYAAFIVGFLTTVLPLRAALRTIGTWERSNTLVAAVSTGCAARDDGNGGTYDTCDPSWSVNGRQYVQNRSANDVYPDGTIVGLWVDPPWLQRWRGGAISRGSRNPRRRPCPRSRTRSRPGRIRTASKTRRHEDTKTRRREVSTHESPRSYCRAAQHRRAEWPVAVA